MDDDFIGTPLTQVPQSSPKPVETTPLTIKSCNIGGWQSTSTPGIIESSQMYGFPNNWSMIMESQPSNLSVNGIPGQAFDPPGRNYGYSDPVVTDLQPCYNRDNAAFEGENFLRY